MSLPTTITPDAGPGAPRPAPAADPRAAKMQVRQLSTAPWLSQALYAVTKLGVPDALAGGPRPVEEVAAEVGAHADTLHRFLRALASAGFFAEPAPRTYALAPPSDQLRSDRPDSMRHVVVMHGEQTFRAWADVLHTARTGRPAFERVYGAPFYDYLTENPEAERVFNAAMGVSGAPPLVVDALDLSAAQVVVDAGGGSGALLAHLLTGHEHLRGVLVDLEDAVVDGEARMRDAGLSDRATCVAGSFFDPLPAADACFLTRVLHNWGDEDALRILRNVRAALPDAGRLYIVDRLVPDVPGPHPGKIADLVMLVVLGGRDRTAAEYEQLLEAAGFGVEAVETPPPGSDPRAESAIIARPRPAG